MNPKKELTIDRKNMNKDKIWLKGFQQGRTQRLNEVKEKIEKLKEKIKKCGNLNYKVVEDEWDGGTRFERDLTNSAIVLEYIDEFLSSLDEKENNSHLEDKISQQLPTTRSHRKGENKTSGSDNTQTPKVFIERAEPLTKEGIKAICMNDKDYEEYCKNRDTQSSSPRKLSGVKSAENSNLDTLRGCNQHQSSEVVGSNEKENSEGEK